MNNKIVLSALAAVIVAGGGYLAYAGQPGQREALTGDQRNQAENQQTNQMGGLNSGENPEPGGVHGLQPEPAAAKARADLAVKLGVSEGSIVIMLVEEKTWSDGCLGLGGPAESCLAALVDGFRVELVASGKTYVYRTDKTGMSLRME